MTFRQGAMALVLAGLLSGCVAGGSSSTSAPKPGVCPADKSMVQTTLYFGLSRPAGKDITAEEWQQFVDRRHAALRDGLTVFDAHGQWLGQNGQVVREQSKALMVIHGHDAQSEAGIEALRRAINHASRRSR